MNRTALLLSVFAALSTASAQSFPNKGLNLIVPWSAGGSSDLTSRALAAEMSRNIGETVTVVSRTGGGGAVGHLAIAQARPTGYDFGLATLEVVIPSWITQTGIKLEQFTPISLVSINPAAITVAKNSPFKTIAELTAFIKANPGKLKASGTAKGGSWDMARAGYLKTIGVKESALPWVPAQGSAAAMQELIAGGVDVITVSAAEVANLVKSGEARTLAVMSDKRHPNYPSIPTLKESGIDWSFGSFLSIMGPRRLSAEVVTKIDASVRQAMSTPEFTKFMTNAGFGINYKNPAQFRLFLTQQAAKMREVQAFIDAK